MLWKVKALGAFVGVSAYRKLEMSPRLLRITVALLLAVNLIKWIVFGRISDSEIRHLRHNIQYTLWEFCCAFFIFWSKGVDQTPQVAAKFAALFACVLGIKCFHHLASVRANQVFGRMAWRLGFGLALLLLIDGLLIYKFVAYRHILRDNILVGIFGFEILHMAPQIVLTGFKLVVARPLAPREKAVYVAEFACNFVRFAMVVLFAGVFMYVYTFPLHILPLSYLLLRVLVHHARALLDYQKQLLIVQRLAAPLAVPSDRCVVCLDDYEEVSDASRMRCGHVFHSQCLRHWLRLVPACPVCRTPVR